MRFGLGRAVLLLAAAAAPVSSLAQDYPVRPIRFIVGFAPGGLADLLARALGQKLTPALGQQVVVDNRPGGGGVVAMQLAAEAAPDGYTLALGSSTTFSINPVLRKVPYDPIRDYTPITRAALTPVILTVHPSFPARSLQELIKLAKAKPDQVMNFASTGFGGATHIAAELLKRVAGIEMTHVPYKGGSLAVIDLIGGPHGKSTQRSSPLWARPSSGSSSLTRASSSWARRRRRPPPTSKSSSRIGRAC
ncbi:MAG: tripartite tricarboxylate transporter substrate binding protein [Betaproteobacteria bacterium]|nr:tripartite tricarboxylate transporter substrate binding protein [Betaproteobacteria bacterium]